MGMKASKEEVQIKANIASVYTKNEVEGILNLKRDKSTLITMNDLSSDGSVAVVGANSVGSTELKDNSITENKISYKI